MATFTGQMPLSGFGGVPPTARPPTSLGFPTMRPPTPVMTPGAMPHAPDGANRVAPPPGAGAPAAAPVENVPTSVVGPGAPPAAAPGAGPPMTQDQFGHDGRFEQKWQDRLTAMAQRPGFFDRLQSMMSDPGNSRLLNRLTHRDPGFDWQSFINGLRPPASATPPVGAAAAPAVAPTGAVPPNPAIPFDPLHLIGG